MTCFDILNIEYNEEGYLLDFNLPDTMRICVKEGDNWSHTEEAIRKQINNMEELYANDLYQKVSQAFTVFLPVRSVGVMGDARKYDYVVALRAVETIDFMTARWAHLPYEFLEKCSNRIINEVDGISRVTYDISSKPPATIEWE